MLKNETHLNFVLAGANLRAFNYGITRTSLIHCFLVHLSNISLYAEEKDFARIVKILPNVIVPEFKPKKLTINTDENADNNSNQNNNAVRAFPA